MFCYLACSVLSCLADLIPPANLSGSFFCRVGFVSIGGGFFWLGLAEGEGWDRRWITGWDGMGWVICKGIAFFGGCEGKGDLYKGG